MKKIKFLLLIIVVLLFSGCTGDYNLTFNKDLSVKEELDISIKNENDNYEKTYHLLEQAGIPEEDYEIVLIDDDIRITYSKEYESFEDYYLNSSLYKMLFEELEYKKDNMGMSINAESVLKLNDKDNQNIINSYDIDNFRINIKSPFSVNKSNANSSKDDTYTWVLDSNDTYKNISINYSYKTDTARNIIMILLIGAASLVIIVYVVTYLVRNRRI